jgi:hypothetical protein
MIGSIEKNGRIFSPLSGGRVVNFKYEDEGNQFLLSDNNDKTPGFNSSEGTFSSFFQQKRISN